MKFLPLFFRSFLCSGAFAASAIAQAESAVADPSVSISALVTEIALHNPELKFYEEEIAAAKAGRRSATRLNDPELSLDVGRKRVRDASGFLAGEGTTWSVSVMQTFDWPGRRDLRKAIANHQVVLAELGLERFKRALDARARGLAYGLYAANAKATAIREVAERFSDLKETFLARDPAGITPLLETRVVEAGELALQRRASEAELALQSSLIELNQLRGAPLDAPLRVAANAVSVSAVPTTDTLLSAAHENNFEFRLRRAELEQQGYNVQLARSERYPSVSAGPFVSRENAGDRETVVGLSLSMPLPVSGRGRSSIDGAESRRRQAETAMLVAQRELDRTVITTAQALAIKNAEVKRWTPDAMARFRDAAELADRHYRLGAVPIATYIELQTSYLDAVEALLDTQREALDAALKLQELTGLTFNAVETSP